MDKKTHGQGPEGAFVRTEPTEEELVFANVDASMRAWLDTPEKIKTFLAFADFCRGGRLFAPFLDRATAIQNTGHVLSELIRKREGGADYIEYVDRMSQLNVEYNNIAKMLASYTQKQAHDALNTLLPGKKVSGMKGDFAYFDWREKAKD